MIDVANVLESICELTHVPMAFRVFGEHGTDAIFQVMKAVKEVFRHVEPERVTNSVVVFRRIDGGRPVGGTAISYHQLADSVAADIHIEIGDAGEPYFCELSDVQLEALPQRAVVYVFKGGHETFLAGTEQTDVYRLDASARSQFAIPTFATLRQALLSYALENVRDSTCFILADAWWDTNRLFLKAGPEYIMRNSLVQFLRNRLGAEHDVLPEQNVDNSHPVDIKVVPRFANNRLMLIEIKWLGDSAAEDGHVTVRHRQARAQEGADQLAQYLEDQRRFAPLRVIQGYYVIVDARRKNLAEGVTSISREDGYHFESLELVFNPAQHQLRTDFDPPYRMFARPVVSAS